MEEPNTTDTVIWERDPMARREEEWRQSLTDEQRAALPRGYARRTRNPLSIPLSPRQKRRLWERELQRLPKRRRASVPLWAACLAAAFSALAAGLGGYGLGTFVSRQSPPALVPASARLPSLPPPVPWDQELRQAKLVEAASKRDAATMQALLAQGANPNARDETQNPANGPTALMVAAHHGDGAAVNALLAHGADVNATGLSIEAIANGGDDTPDSTPLTEALGQGHVGIAESLLKHGASVNAPNSLGETPLMLSVSLGDVPAVKLLLANGADVNAKADNGKTSLMLAAEGARVDIAQLLLAKGADVNAKDNDGATALIWGTYHPAIVQLLKGAGAKE